MSKPFWPAISVTLAILALGLTAFYNGSTLLGVALVLLALGVYAAYLGMERRQRQSTERMVEWLIEAAQYGTKYIQNATDHDVTGVDDVPRLVERHDRWVATIKAHAACYLQKSDEDHVSWFHSYDPKGMNGLNDDHRRIRDWTAERVDRLKVVARRLQDGAATIKRYRPQP